jgi:hypothetical protein
MTGHQPLEEHRTTDEFMNADCATPAERMQHTAGMPLVSVRLHDLEHHWLIVSAAIRDEGSRRFEDVLHDNIPITCSLGEPLRDGDCLARLASVLHVGETATRPQPIASPTPERRG